jgi:hypothetical protein
VLMRRQLAMAALVAVLVPASWAQMRGAFRSAAPAPRLGFAARGPGVTNRGTIFVARPGFGFRFRSGFFPGPFFFNRGFHRRGVFFGGIPWWGYAGYPGYYSGYSYATDENASYVSANAFYQQNREMQSEIERLRDEIERLRDEQELRYPPAPSPRPQAESKPEPHEPTTLVFRDKHTQQVQNYAIVGQSLWIFDEQRATKVPLSFLDLEATRKTNDERGIEFQIPK